MLGKVNFGSVSVKTNNKTNNNRVKFGDLVIPDNFDNINTTAIDEVYDEFSAIISAKVNSFLAENRIETDKESLDRIDHPIDRSVECVSSFATLKIKIGSKEFKDKMEQAMIESLRHKEFKRLERLEEKDRDITFIPNTTDSSIFIPKKSTNPNQKLFDDHRDKDPGIKMAAKIKYTN